MKTLGTLVDIKTGGFSVRLVNIEIQLALIINFQ